MNRSVTVSLKPALLTLLALLVVLGVAVAGCGSSNNPSASSGGAAMQPHAANLGNSDSMVAQGDVADEAVPARDTVQRRAVISTGSIELTSGDVAATRDRIDAVLAREGGRVADETTTTDDKGTVTGTHLVVRVPSSRFDDAMTALSGLATLRSASRKAQDVTTRVIDLEARIKAERAGVRRLRHLVSRTANLRALLDVERALTERQGELESLQQQRTYLHDQTTDATISVDVSRRTAPAPVHHAAGGFVGGLQHGWAALVAVVVALLVALGAVLPFAVVLALLGVPAWIVVRRLRRVRRLRAPAES